VPDKIIPLSEKTRKRKTKNPCSGCGLHAIFCICDAIPSLSLVTKISLVIHKNELRRTTNTGKLAIRALKNSEMHVIGNADAPFRLETILSPEYHSLLLYPADDALELDPSLLAQIKKPVQLIVPDGNWRQASKVHYRNKHLSTLQRVKFNLPNTASHFLRTESKEVGMATLEAIAHALGVLEGEIVKNILLSLYAAKLQNTLASRGQIP
jgi:DTW domain-containing protein YfiP